MFKYTADKCMVILNLEKSFHILVKELLSMGELF